MGDECEPIYLCMRDYSTLIDSTGSSDANEAVSLELVEADSNALRTISRFHPKFTYPIFGEEERIFGYKGLDITFRFAAHDLRPNCVISYEHRFPAIADTAALDIRDALQDYIPAGLSFTVRNDALHSC